MQKLVSTVVTLSLLVSTIITSIPRSTRAAETEDESVARWPHPIVRDEATIVVDQPQAVAWKEYRSLDVRMAVGVTQKGAQEPVLRTVEASVDTHTHFDTRSVVVSNLKLRSSRFPSLDTQQAAAMEQLIQQAIAVEPPARCHSPESEAEERRGQRRGAQAQRSDGRCDLQRRAAVQAHRGHQDDLCTADFNQLNQDRHARTQGFQRQEDFNAWRSSGQSAHDFGHRSFSGGFRSGGFHGGFHRR